jgi:hypothetical protein
LCLQVLSSDFARSIVGKSKFELGIDTRARKHVVSRSQSLSNACTATFTSARAKSLPGTSIQMLDLPTHSQPGDKQTCWSAEVVWYRDSAKNRQSEANTNSTVYQRVATSDERAPWPTRRHMCTLLARVTTTCNRTRTLSQSSSQSRARNSTVPASSDIGRHCSLASTTTHVYSACTRMSARRERLFTSGERQTTRVPNTV